MNCTTYDAAISYDAPIAYNGVCVAPPTPSIAGYGGGRVYNYVQPIPEDDEIIAMMLLELLDD